MNLKEQGRVREQITRLEIRVDLLRKFEAEVRAALESISSRISTLEGKKVWKKSPTSNLQP